MATPVEPSYSIATVGIVVFAAAALLIWLSGSSSKLDHVPGPFIGRYTDWVLRYHGLRGTSWSYVDRMHRKYGPVVRIVPHEVSVASPTATREIYRVGGDYYKGPFYNMFNSPDPDDPNPIFSERDTKIHAQGRRIRAHYFADKSIKPLTVNMMRGAQLTTQRIAEDVRKQGYADVYKWFLFMATDTVGEASFGESFNMLQTGVQNQYTSDLRMMQSFLVVAKELPFILPILRRFGAGKQVLEVRERMNVYAEESIQRYHRIYEADPANAKPTLLASEFALEAAGTIDHARVVINARGNIIAGSETTTSALTSLIFLLAQHPAIEAAFIKEVATLPPDFTEEDTRRIPLVDQIINETLRVHPPVGQGLQRVVPPSGTTFHGIHLPGGTNVAIPAYTMHHDPTIYPRPEVYDPSRWAHATPDMKTAQLTWGGGSRTCMGIHFALAELRLTLCHFYRAFPQGVECAEGVNGFRAAYDMSIFQGFLSHPRGDRCLIRPRAGGATP